MGLGGELRDEDGNVASVTQTFEKKREEHIRELQAKEDEMRQLFVQRLAVTVCVSFFLSLLLLVVSLALLVRYVFTRGQ